MTIFAAANWSRFTNINRTTVFQVLSVSYKKLKNAGAGDASPLTAKILLGKIDYT